jgi:hypothetical protein
MDENGMMTLQGDPLVANLFPRVTHLLGNHANHQGERDKRNDFQVNVFIIKRRLFVKCSNASIIKMTLTTRPDLLPHEARHVVLYGPSWCVGRC